MILFGGRIRPARCRPLLYNMINLATEESPTKAVETI